MRKLVLMPCILGFASLIVGSTLAIQGYSSSLTIHTWGTLLPYWDESSLPNPETSNSTQLNQIGYLTILLSAGFFSIGFLINRKRD